MMILSSWYVLCILGCGATRQPSAPILAIAQYLRISENILPDFLDGCFPVLR